MDTEVTVVSTAVKAEVDSKGHRRPRRVLSATVEADLDIDRLASCWPDDVRGCVSLCNYTPYWSGGT